MEQRLQWYLCSFGTFHTMSQMILGPYLLSVLFIHLSGITVTSLSTRRILSLQNDFFMSSRHSVEQVVHNTLKQLKDRRRKNGRKFEHTKQLLGWNKDFSHFRRTVEWLQKLLKHFAAQLAAMNKKQIAC